MKSNDEKQPRPAVTTKGSAAGQKPQNPDNWRETIESIVVAFVLAFLFRTFEAEAFVIPTGSMAPTLYGQQRDVTCTQCGTRFACGVSSGPATDAELRDGGRDDRGKDAGLQIVPRDRSQFAICPNANCRFPNNILDHEMFAGDRILVNKFPFEFKDPERWDVVVFKFPEQAKTNYIKRLAGMPGEELRIEDGDVKVRKIGGSDMSYRVARKTPEKQRHLQLLVHDNDHPANQLLEAGWPEAWAKVEASAWNADAKARSFRVDPHATDSEEWHWLRYSHYVPKAEDWTLVLDGKAPPQPTPQLIRDFYAYNSRITVGEAESAWRRGELPDLHGNSNEPDQWVGDLTLTCRVEVLASGGELRIELVEGKRRYWCTIDLASGRGRFEYVHDLDREGEDPRPAGEPFETGMNRPGKYAVSFANVDDRLCLWIDDRLVKPLDFDPGSKFEPQIPPVRSSDRDTAPVGIAARMATLRVDHLKIERDIFYRHEPGGINEAHEKKFVLNQDENDPANDEFLMLGDNSPRSNDSRLWAQSHAVP
ncbi:MAG TPA: signal peptidase I, partial [Planctomycetaceae bacterium]